MRHFFQSIGPASGDHSSKPLLGERYCCCLSDPASSAGDKGDFPVRAHAIVSFYVGWIRYQFGAERRYSTRHAKRHEENQRWPTRSTLTGNGTENRPGRRWSSASTGAIPNISNAALPTVSSRRSAHSAIGVSS